MEDVGKMSAIKKFQLLILLICFLAVVPVVAVHAQPSTVIYVSSDGSDAKGNGSSGNPYATIAHAVGVAPAGAAIMVAPGTYTESVTITKPLTLESESSQPTNTIINAAGYLNGIAITGADANGTTVEGLTVENANAEGIYVQDTSQVTIQYDYALDNTLNASQVCPINIVPTTPPCIAEDKGIELIGTSHSAVVGNTVIGTVADGGIGLSDDGPLNPGIVENMFHPATPGGNNPSAHNLVADNTVINNAGGCGIVVSAYDLGEGVLDNVVSNNLVSGNAEGIVVATPVPATSAINNTVKDNTIVNSATEGIDIDGSSPNTTVSGNIVTGNVLSGNGPDYDFPKPGPTAIAVLSPTSDPVTGTLVTANVIQNEVYGVGVFNASQTTILGNTADSSVKVPLFGASENQTAVSALSGQMSTLQGSLNTLQNSLASVQTQTSNAMYLGYAAIAIAVVLGGVAIALSRRRPSPPSTG
jgi:parallel beta-helix repeat protein